jgi:MoaA/NifB/PqqE/SkfB family radical SAM enzyme
MKYLTQAVKERLFKASESSGAHAHISSIVEKRPLDINIETTNFCPMSCVFCPNHKARRSKHVMEMGLFRSICEDFHRIGGGAVGICSMQSDLFSDDLLLERLAELTPYQKLFRLHSTTNLVGAARLSDAELEFLLRSFHYLEISIGGLTREEYRTMYGADAFDTVKEQLFRVADLVKKKELGITLDISIRTNKMHRLRIAKYVHSKLLNELKKTYNVYNTRNSFFSWGGLVSQDDLPEGAKIRTTDNRSVTEDCIVPWSTLSINSDGKVIGCGCIDWEARHVIGDMRSQNICEIWNSQAATAFRTSFSRGDIPRLCSDCSQHHAKDRAFSRKSLLEYQVTDGLHYKR